MTTLSLDSLTTLSLRCSARMREDREEALRRFDDARVVIGATRHSLGRRPPRLHLLGRQAQKLRPLGHLPPGPRPRASQGAQQARCRCSCRQTRSSASTSGGAGIDRFRGVEPGAAPEHPRTGSRRPRPPSATTPRALRRSPDGRILRDVIAADPVAYLGAEHVAGLGVNPGLLVKLLDAGERLAVHFHPERGVRPRASELGLRQDGGVADPRGRARGAHAPGTARADRPRRPLSAG